MKFLKRLWIGLLLALAVAFASPAEAQRTVALTPQWQQVGQKCVDCGSAFFMVYRSAFPNQLGQYEAYVYVWSNSFNRNGIAVATYVSRPRIYAVDAWGRRFPNPIVSMEYHLASPQSSSFNGWNLMFYLYSPSPNQGYLLEFDYLDNY